MRKLWPVLVLAAALLMMNRSCRERALEWLPAAEEPESDVATDDSPPDRAPAPRGANERHESFGDPSRGAGAHAVRNAIEQGLTQQRP